MELAVGVTIRQLLFHVHCASKLEAPGHAGVSPRESLLGVPNNELCTRLWLVNHQVLFSRQIIVAVCMGVRIWATIRQVGKQVPLVVVQTESTFLLLHGVHLKTNSQACGLLYSNRNYQAHLVEFRADAAIDYVCQGSTIVHAHVILVLEPLDLGPRHALCNRLVPHVHRVVHPCDGLKCVAHGERVHFKAKVDELDDRIALSLVLDIAHFSGL